MYYVYAFIWFCFAVYIHSRLWGDYEIPPEDSFIFFIIDAFVSFVLLAVVGLILGGFSTLYKKLTAKR